MKQTQRYILLGFFSLGLSAAVLLGIYHFQKPTSTILYQQETQIADIGGDFILTDQYGKLRDTKEFRGKFLLLYFGYTYCPDVCPMALENITVALKNLHRDRDKVAVVFVSVDPERDTPDVLKLYATNFDPNILMLTGSLDELRKAMQQYKVYAKKETNSQMSDYLINHTSMVYVLDPKGKYLEGFAHSTDPKTITSKLLKLLHNALPSQ